MLSAVISGGMLAASSCSDRMPDAPEEGGTENTDPEPEQKPDPGQEDMTARTVAERLGLGWNLGNQMDSHINGVASETGWGNNAATQATFDRISEAGFSSVRIPVTWLGQFGDRPEYTINAEWLDRVAELVGYA